MNQNQNELAQIRELFESAVSRGWIVMIEPDGQKLPTAWYRLLKKLAGIKDSKASAIIGRGSQVHDPIERRMDVMGGRGVVFQECLIMVPSKSFADMLVAFIYEVVNPAIMSRTIEQNNGIEPRPVTVAVSRVGVTVNPTLGDMAYKDLNTVTAKLSRPGRRPAPEDFVIQCAECLTVSQVNTWEPVNCPACSGVRIHWRYGTAIAFDASPEMGVLDTWVASRYVYSSHMESCVVVDEGNTYTGLGRVTELPHPARARWPKGHKEIRDAIEANQELMAMLESLPLNQALWALDAIVTARTRYGEDQRHEARVTQVSGYLSALAGTVLQPVPVSFLEDPDAPDIFDAAIHCGPTVVAWMKHYYHRGQ